MTRTAKDAQHDVFVWVVRLRGQSRGVAVFCDKNTARAWATDAIGDGGEWNNGDGRKRYDSGGDTALIDRVTIPDAAALVTIDPPTA